MVLTLAGEVDLATVDLLRRLLSEATTLSVPSIRVDLSDVSFLDASGLSALVVAEHRIRASGGRLEVQGVPPRLRWLFDITGLSVLLGLGEADHHDALVPALARAAVLPMARTVLDAALRLVVTMAQAVLEGADGVSITLPRNGTLATVAASNDVVLEMDHDQYATGQGPCLDAATQGASFFAQSLLSEPRWPDFVPRARARGIESILSTPLLADGRPVGALNVYSRTSGALAARERAWATQFSEQASAVVVSAQNGPSDRLLAGDIEQALASREVIALAQGAVMQRDGISAGLAYARLREMSRLGDRTLRAVCEDLVAALPAEPDRPDRGRAVPHG